MGSPMQQHGHSHSGHGHGHAHGTPARADLAFALAALLNFGFVIAEAGFGLAANSNALLADAMHNFGDVLGLLLAWGAASLGRRGPTRRRTYGLGRSSILASLVNAMLLLMGVGAIGVEAIRRLMGSFPSAPVASVTVMAVAGAGIAINGVTALLFRSGRHGDLNARAAFIHMAADAATSAGVVASGLAIWLTGWQWLDPATSLVIVSLILVSTWGLLRESADLVLDTVPAHVDRDAIEEYLRGLPGVTAVHDLHIWGLSTTDIALTAHLVRPGKGTDDALLMDAADQLRQNFGIGHSTFQIEEGNEACALEPDHVV
jgi:cobalt-zinc-cadmium efflux system protein